MGSGNKNMWSNMSEWGMDKRIKQGSGVGGQGAEGRGFESLRPDQQKLLIIQLIYSFFPTRRET